MVFFVMAVIATACTDLMFVMIIVNVSVLQTIFCNNIHELNNILKADEWGKPLIKAKLKNISLLLQKFCIAKTLQFSFISIIFNNDHLLSIVVCKFSVLSIV